MGIVDAVEGEVLTVELEDFDGVGDGGADDRCQGRCDQNFLCFPDGLSSHDYNYFCYNQSSNLSFIPTNTLKLPPNPYTPTKNTLK